MGPILEASWDALLRHSWLGHRACSQQGAGQEAWAGVGEGLKSLARGLGKRSFEGIACSVANELVVYMPRGTRPWRIIGIIIDS